VGRRLHRHPHGASGPSDAAHRSVPSRRLALAGIAPLGATNLHSLGVDFETHRGVCVKSLSDLKIKLFADGADKAQILKWHGDTLVRGFTTNPTLMRSAGVTDYEAFAREILQIIKDRPISFEVFADDFLEMERQARKIAGWGENVFVKIPVTNTRRQ